MRTYRARVERGRLILDAPTDLPDGTEVDLTIAGSDDDLTDEEEAALAAALSAAWEDVRAGRLRPAEEILRELRSRG